KTDDPRSDAYEPGETVGPESVAPGTVTVSPSKDGTGETDTQPSPGDSRETVGDGQTLTRATPLATPSNPAPECLIAPPWLDKPGGVRLTTRTCHTHGIRPKRVRADRA